MRLNIGSGKRQIEGYTNIDAVKRAGVHIVAEAHKIPLDDGCADEILAVHLWEHFYLWDCEKVINEWRRLLKNGGRLNLELPNFRKCCENFLTGRTGDGKSPDQLSYWGVYGDPRDKDPYMTHRWGWTPETITQFLSQHGFRNIIETPTHFHLVGRNHRDMRIEAIK